MSSAAARANVVFLFPDAAGGKEGGSHLEAGETWGGGGGLPGDLRTEFATMSRPRATLQVLAARCDGISRLVLFHKLCGRLGDCDSCCEHGAVTLSGSSHTRAGRRFDFPVNG